MSEIGVALGLLFAGALGATLAFGYLAFAHLDKLEKIAGWIAKLVAAIWRKADKTAVALRVQGHVNGLQAGLHKDAPVVIDKRLKINWADAAEAEAVVRGGDVVVFMRDSRRHEENIANAVMAFLPKALLARARRYVERDTMRAIDLTVAKALLSQDDASEGALDVFYERHLDPARDGSNRLKQKIAELDMVDLHGWLSRILLAEYRRIGESLYPSEPDEDCLAEAERVADWLAKLANRKKDELGSLTFRGRYFNVAIIFVANKHVLAEKGIEPYRKRAKRHLYTDKFDSVYLLARDPNLPAVDEVVASFGADAIVAGKAVHKYRLRRDFAARQKLNREHAVCVRLLRRGVTEPEEWSEEDAASDLPEEDEYAQAAEDAPEQDADPEVTGSRVEQL